MIQKDIDKVQISTKLEPKREKWNSLIIFELLFIIVLNVANAYDLVPFSITPFILLLGWISLRLRGLKWSSIGFRLPPQPLRAIALGVGLGIFIEFFAMYVTTPLIESISGSEIDLSDLQELVGNIAFFGVMLLINWTLAAFGEELVFRGYLLNRLSGFFQNTRGALVGCVVLVSIYFGFIHSYQGIAGMIQESLSGFWLGMMFVLSSRNLTIPIIAHGVSNTVALVFIYFGNYPGIT